MVMATTRDDRTLGELFAELSRETSALVRQEVALAKAEMSEKASTIAKNVVLLVAGGAIVYLAAVFILLALVIGLANVMEPWLAALIVGAVVAVVGTVLIITGINTLKATTIVPEKTIATLKENKEWVQQQVK
jgi:xanthine/uracil permease